MTDFSSALTSSTDFPKNKNHSCVEKIVVDVSRGPTFVLTGMGYFFSRRKTTWCGDPVSASKREGEEEEADVSDQRCEEGHSEPRLSTCLHPSLWSQYSTRKSAGQGEFIYTHTHTQASVYTQTHAVPYCYPLFPAPGDWGHKSLGSGYIQDSWVFWKPPSDGDHVLRLPGRRLARLKSLLKNQKGKKKKDAWKSK